MRSLRRWFTAVPEAAAAAMLEPARPGRVMIERLPLLGIGSEVCLCGWLQSTRYQAHGRAAVLMAG